MTVLRHKRLAKAGTAASPLLGEVNSVALSRLIEEVRNSGDADHIEMTAYNRTYHRHNR